MCSCGNTAPHVIARRTTSDDYDILFWSDGDVTQAFSYTFPGVGRARSMSGEDRNREANVLLCGVIELLDFAEVPRAIHAARKAVTQQWTLPREAFWRFL